MHPVDIGPGRLGCPLSHPLQQYRLSGAVDSAQRHTLPAYILGKCHGTCDLRKRGLCICPGQGTTLVEGREQDVSPNQDTCYRYSLLPTDKD